MSRSTSHVPTLRPLRCVYRRMLALAVPAALAACQGAADPLAPDAAGDPSAPAASSVTETAAPSSDLLGALTPDRITFTGYTADNGGDIWSMDPQGGSLVHLTSFTGLEYEPSWSYDHTRIAFSRMRTYGTDIYLVNADGTNKHWARSAIYPGPIDEPSWSPDGTHLLVRIQFQAHLCLASIDLATGNMALVAPAGLLAVEGGHPMYDLTGKTIFYVDGTGKTIKRFTPGGAQTTVYTSSSYIDDPALSPDGTKLAFAAGLTATDGEIYALTIATKAVKRLTFNSIADQNPAWSPDGTKLAFASYKTGRMQIWTMNSSTGGNLTRITNRTYGAVTPSWAQ
jgi:Tol biopolymer transport system component